MEFAVPTHIPESMWEQTITTQAQFELTQRYFEPVKDRLIFACSGNHDWRCYKKTGIDITKILSQHLGCFYNAAGGYIQLNVGNQNYKFNIFHGASGAQVNIWAELEKRWAVFHDADLIAAGHIHHLAHKAIPKLRLYNGREQREFVHFVRTGSFITEPLYSRMSAYSPTLDGAPVITLDGDRHNIHVDVDGETRWGNAFSK